MVDEESQDVASEPAAAGAPANRDRRRDPGVVEGEIAGREASSPAPSASTSDSSGLPPAATRSGGFRPFLWGALGGLVVAALGLAGGYLFYAPQADLAEADASRLAALESQAQRAASAAEGQARRQSEAIASLEKRVATLDASKSAGSALDQRLTVLEASSQSNAAGIATAADAEKSLSGQVKDLRGDLEAARGQIPALTARVGKLESSLPAQSGAASAELSALAARVDKLEAALAAPKTETRAAPEAAKAEDNAAAVAIIVRALADKLAMGAPYGTELAALERLGVDPAKLAPLKALANGAPTGRALAAAFDAVTPKALAAAAPAAQGGVLDRFLTHVRDLVRVRDLGETGGDDRAALVSQIEAESRRGDFGAALAAFAKLPEPARKAGAEWAAAAGARQAADMAVQSIRDAAIGRLAGGEKP